MVLSTLAAILAILGATGAATASASNYSNNRQKGENEELKKLLDEYGITGDQKEALLNEFGLDTNGNMFENAWNNLGKSADLEGLKEQLDLMEKLHDTVGDFKDLTPADLDNAEQRAYAQLDSENAQLRDLFQQSLDNSTNLLNDSLLDNSRMFNDYRNQMLANDAMSQQAIAGSTRFELDRQQRNSIIRGASAAQRLVANINTQLGTQAQSAQQALNTSNALAQALVNQRQAQQNIRSQYMDAQNQYNSNMASMISGSTERRNAYGQQARDQAQYNWNQNRDLQNQRLADSGLGSAGQAAYRQKYGNNAI